MNAIAISLFFSFLARAGAPPVDQIVRKADELRGPEGELTFRVRVKDYNKGSLVHENVYKVMSKNGKYVLIETEFPERLQGRKILMRDNDLWLYLPSIKRATRVSLQQRLTGEVSNGDLAKTCFHDDYSSKLLKSSADRFEVMLTARHKEAAYRKVKLHVDAKSFRPLRAEYFAISGKKLKSSEYGEYENVLGVQRATKVVIRDALQPSRLSQLKFYDYRRENLDASLFAKESLP